MQITSGLQAIHAVGVVHGDVKPENILIFRSAEGGYIAKLADFGSAIVLADITLPSSRPLGTVLYSAPECYPGGTTTFKRDELIKMDIFSLGMTLACLLQGMHVLEDINQLSASRLESLKRSDRLAGWLVEHKRQRPQTAGLRPG
ncbi:kinase-like domain-containing protein, partial [Podospora didyma]